MTTHVLILCTHNSARSILAEAVLAHEAARLGADVRAHSAGSAPSGRVQPLAIAALRRAGIATDGLRSKSWDEFAAPGAPPIALVVTVCDAAAGEACPAFRGADGHAPLRAHWGHADPSRVDGDEAARLAAFEATRDALGAQMRRLLALPLATGERARLAADVAAIGR